MEKLLSPSRDFKALHKKLLKLAFPQRKGKSEDYLKESILMKLCIKESRKSRRKKLTWLSSDIDFPRDCFEPFKLPKIVVHSARDCLRRKLRTFLTNIPCRCREVKEAKKKKLLKRIQFLIS